MASSGGGPPSLGLDRGPVVLAGLLGLRGRRLLVGPPAAGRVWPLTPPAAGTEWRGPAAKQRPEAVPHLERGPPVLDDQAIARGVLAPLVLPPDPAQLTVPPIVAGSPGLLAEVLGGALEPLRLNLLGRRHVAIPRRLEGPQEVGEPFKQALDIRHAPSSPRIGAAMGVAEVEYPAGCPVLRVLLELALHAVAVQLVGRVAHVLGLLLPGSGWPGLALRGHAPLCGTANVHGRRAQNRPEAHAVASKLNVAGQHAVDLGLKGELLAALRAVLTATPSATFTSGPTWR